METSEKNNRMHLGRKISRIRELRGMKQDTLAFEMGLSQQAISKLEQSADIEEATLDKIAKIMGLSSDAIKNFSEDAIFNIIGNTVTNHDNAALFNYYPSFNPIDKLMELVEANKNLYERLLKSEQEKAEIIKKCS